MCNWQQVLSTAFSKDTNGLVRRIRAGLGGSSKCLLADDPLPQLHREFPNAVELSRLAHFIRAGRLRERKKAMAVVASLKRIPSMVTAKCLQIHPRAVTRYFNRYAAGGTAGLFYRPRAKGKDYEQDKQC